MRSDWTRLGDVLAAASAIDSQVPRGDIDDGLVFDAVRVRLIEIGEAVKDIDPALLATEPEIPWRDVMSMRDHLTHRYFDAAHDIVGATVARDLPPLVDAVQRLLLRVEVSDQNHASASDRRVDETPDDGPA